MSKSLRGGGGCFVSVFLGEKGRVRAGLEEKNKINLRTLAWFTQSRLSEELNQEKVVISHVGITSHSGGMVTEARGLTITALETRLKEERKRERVVLVIILACVSWMASL